MDAVFLKILNMSIAAGWLILAVVFLRLLLKKAPRWVHVLLWGVVALRLMNPFTIESAMSLIPNAEPIPLDIAMEEEPTIDSGIGTVDDAVNGALTESFTPNPGDSANPLQIWIPILTAAWMTGMVLLLLYAFISYYRLHRRVATAVRYKDNIYQSENVVSPFVLGIIKPKIYLPFALETLKPIIAHEQAHIHRKDHWWKPLGFLLLTIHWFNPLMWLAYVLLCRDIELACDEKVIQDMSAEQKADYMQTLLCCSTRHKSITACPLAFGEVGVKKRVKSVLHYKKPAFWVLLAAIVACGAVAVSFLTDPAEKEPDLSFLNYENAMSLVMDVDEVMVIYCPPDTTEIRIGAADGVELTKQLDRWEWRQCRQPWRELISPGSIEFVIEEEYRITVHERRYAVVKYGDEERYYRIERNDYEEAYALVHGPGAQNCTFEAEVLEVREGVLLVEPVEGSFERRSADQITVANMASSEPQVGDIVEVTYDGYIMETYPASLGEVFEVKVVEHKPILTLEDILILSEKGQDLSWEDFEEYQYAETGSGLYIHLYKVTGGFELWIGGGSTSDAPMYMNLLKEGESEGVEIREGDLEEYLRESLHAKTLYAPTSISEMEACYDREDWVTTRLYYEIGDEWVCNGYSYPHRLEITGEMPGTDGLCQSFLVLSSTKDLTFQQVLNASGISSNLGDYFLPEEAVIVANRVFKAE